MNIQRAKQEMKHTIAAYLQRDAQGEYYIPPLRQRPILLMGPPGIGKTQIMQQIARECDLALVSYTITHHTRQSAIGLPFIREKTYGGEKRSVTEYTMSEIIASVYDVMEASGKREGILFIDEINCVSETLAPAMLQFLQGKTFGNQKVPEGWIIVAAGNPSQYNRSVREFDVVTLDRVKVMNVEPDYAVWKAYAYEAGIHESIISYLDIRKDRFYRIETTVDGIAFVTARGWQDLSELIYAYERLGFTVDREVTVQYLQEVETAKDFANYLELYYKYQSDYQVEEILKGRIAPGTLNKLKFAPFDERIKVVSLLLARLMEGFRQIYHQDQVLGRLFALLKEGNRAHAPREEARMQPGETSGTILAFLKQEYAREQEAYRARLAAGQNGRDLKKTYAQVLTALEDWIKLLERYGTAREAGLGPQEGFSLLREAFLQRRDQLEERTKEVSGQLEHAFDFMEAAFGESQEMIVFITELSINRYAAAFLEENDCDRYFRYNKSLLFADQEAAVRSQLDEIRQMQIT